MKLRKETEKTTFLGTGALSLAQYWDVRDYDIISMAIRNLGPGAISAFQLRANPSMKDTAAAIIIKSSNFIVADTVIVSSTGDPTTLASGGSVLLDVDTSYRSQLHIYINAPVGTTVELIAGLYVYDI